MRTNMGLILHNLKKQKSQFVSFGIMVLITAFIVNIALVLAFQTSAAYDERFAELHTAQVNVILPLVCDTDALPDEIEAVKGVSFAEKHEGVFVSATVREFAGSDFDMTTVFYNLDGERSVNLLDVSEDGKKAGDSDTSGSGQKVADLDGVSDAGKSSHNAVYVPEYMTKLGGFQVGDDITYSIGGEDYTFTIAGVVSEMQYGNYGTGLIGAYLPDKTYEWFAEENDSAQVAEYSLRTMPDAELTEVKNGVVSLMNEKSVPLLSVNDHVSAKQTRTMVCTLLIVIFLALAAIILLVNIFLSNFRIRNNIEDEMTNMGVFKAIGYTSRMIIFSSVVPYTLVGGVSGIIGAALSYTLLPMVADILATQSGFSFAPAFDLPAFFLTIIIPTALILLFTWLAAGKIRKLEPINAIRGITGEGASRNHFPLEDAKVGVRFTLVLKQIASSAGQNVLLFVLSFGIMVLLSFAGTLLYNVSVKPDNFLDTLSEESPSVIFTAKEDSLEELKACLQKDSRVERVIEYAQTPVSYEDGSLACFVCEDFSLVTNDICYEGKNPLRDDEIAVGSALAEQYEVGGKITITSGDNAYDYTITGFVQSVNNNGAVCELTGEGYKRLNEKEPGVLNVYLQDGKAADMIEEWEEEHGEWIASSVNYAQLAENGQKMYAGIVSAVTVVLFLISVLVVLLVMYIIINSMLTRRRQEFGIYKALGYSSRQLILQSAFCFVPVIAVSAVLSAVAGLSYMPAINNMMFGMLGAMKNHFEVSLGFLLIFAVLFTVVSFLISVILATPIKYITAYSLLKE